MREERTIAGIILKVLVLMICSGLTENYRLDKETRKQKPLLGMFVYVVSWCMYSGIYDFIF